MAFVSWWYGAGWRLQVQRMRTRLLKVVDMFSIDLLLKTLFLPFRQISADRSDGAIGDKIRAWADKMVSRIIGAVVRLITIIAGVLVLAVALIINVAIVAAWPLVPILPIVGIFCTITGWLPWQM